ncbi:hypothetical protein AB6A40_008935 [Gnathostoma spinigerum]|uniref:Large ribosomal subunit protein mL40 n=1 Tax=Gnathostoma spinigerum TaxID=75299 RepID=A0ABD6EXL7_9BILA
MFSLPYVIRRVFLTSFKSDRFISLTAANNTSAFMKRQKKIDPELAKLREMRKRRKLEKEIRLMQKHSKKPKPVEEMTIDIKSAKTINERIRPKAELSEEEIDNRAIALKAYARSRNHLMLMDDAWIRISIEKQEKALQELKKLSPSLYKAAIEPDPDLDNAVEFNGPSLTPPIKNFIPPDGDYIDTTRSWT